MSDMVTELEKLLFGQILISKEIITEHQLNEAIKWQQSVMSHRKIGEILVRLGYISKRHITETLAEQYGLELVDSLDGIQSNIISCIDGTIAILYRIIPVSWRDGKLVIAASDYDANNIDNLKRLLDRDVIVTLADPADISHALIMHYGANSIPDQMPLPVNVEVDDVDEETAGRLLSQPKTLADGVRFFIGVIENLVKRVEALEKKIQ